MFSLLALPDQRIRDNLYKRVADQILDQDIAGRKNTSIELYGEEISISSNLRDDLRAAGFLVCIMDDKGDDIKLGLYIAWTGRTIYRTS